MISLNKNTFNYKYLFLVYLISGLAFFCIIKGTAFANGVIIKPLSIRNGLESQMSLNWPLKNKKAVYTSTYFKEKQVLAKKSGVNLKKKMTKAGVAKFNKENGKFFMLFYNMAKAPSCRRDYLVQRVKLTKSYYKKNGRMYDQRHEYLVEVMKTKRKSTKRADEHVRSYSLNGAYRRVVKVEAEIGCGVVQNKTEGNRWPYSKRSLYELIQDHSDSPGCYEDVRFEFSNKYSFGVDFNRDGIKAIEWPYFIN